MYCIWCGSPMGDNAGDYCPPCSTEKGRAFRRYLEDMADATRPDSMEHMVFVLTMHKLEEGASVRGYLLSNLMYKHKPGVYEAYAAIWRRWQGGAWRPGGCKGA